MSGLPRAFAGETPVQSYAFEAEDWNRLLRGDCLILVTLPKLPPRFHWRRDAIFTAVDGIGGDLDLTEGPQEVRVSSRTTTSAGIAKLAAFYNDRCERPWVFRGDPRETEWLGTCTYDYTVPIAALVGATYDKILGIDGDRAPPGEFRCLIELALSGELSEMCVAESKEVSWPKGFEYDGIRVDVEFPDDDYDILTEPIATELDFLESARSRDALEAAARAGASSSV